MEKLVASTFDVLSPDFLLNLIYSNPCPKRRSTRLKLHICIHVYVVLKFLELAAIKGFNIAEDYLLKI